MVFRDFPSESDLFGVAGAGSFGLTLLVNRLIIRVINSIGRPIFLRKCPTAERGPDLVFHRVSRRLQISGLEYATKL